ncbi:MAG: glycosyltransferase family 2 protein [Acidimicrobiia bacterium]
MTIAIPTFNRVGDLPMAVESVLGQTGIELDVVILDNGSSDGTEQYCRALAVRDGRVRYLRSDRNLGPTENFNRGSREAVSEYFMWLGDDDWVDPGYVRSCVDVLERSPDVVLAAGPVRYYRKGVFAYSGVMVNVDATSGPARVRSYFRQVKDNGTFYGVMRASVLRSVPETTNELGGDWLLLAALAMRGRIATCTRGPMAHRALGGSTSSLRNVAESIGASSFAAEFPQLAIAATVWRDIGWRSPAYAELSPIARWWLGATCAAVIAVRFVVPSVPKYIRLKCRALRLCLKRRSGSPDKHVEAVGGSE